MATISNPTSTAREIISLRQQQTVPKTFLNSSSEYVTTHTVGKPILFKPRILPSAPLPGATTAAASCASSAGSVVASTIVGGCLVAIDPIDARVAPLGRCGVRLPSMEDRSLYSGEALPHNAELERLVCDSNEMILALIEHEYRRAVEQMRRSWTEWEETNREKVGDFEGKYAFFGKTPLVTVNDLDALRSVESASNPDKEEACNVALNAMTVFGLVDSRRAAEGVKLCVESDYVVPDSEEECVVGKGGKPCADERKRKERDSVINYSSALQQLSEPETLRPTALQDARTQLEAVSRILIQHPNSASRLAGVGRVHLCRPEKLKVEDFDALVRTAGTPGSELVQPSANANPVVDNVFALYDVYQGDPLALTAAEFVKSLEVLSQNITAIESLKAERAEVLRRASLASTEAEVSDAQQNVGDAQSHFVRAEELARWIIDLYRETLRVALGRFTTATESTPIEVSEFLKTKASTVRRALEDAEHLVGEQRELEEKSNNDLEGVLPKYLTELYEANERAAEAFTKAGQQFTTAIDDNTQAQQEAWAKIIEQLNVLAILCTERKSTIEKRLASIEVEHIRRRRHSELERLAAQRQRQLDIVLKTCTDAISFLDANTNFARTIDVRVEEKQFPERLRALQAAEAVRYSELYREFALFVGELIYVKHQRRENALRLARATQFQIVTSADTLEADVETYKKHAEELRTTAETISADCALLDHLLDEERTYYTRVQEFIEGRLEDEHGVEGVTDVPGEDGSAPQDTKTSKTTPERRNIVGRRLPKLEDSGKILRSFACNEKSKPDLLLKELERDILRKHVDALDVVTTKEVDIVERARVDVSKLNGMATAARRDFEQSRMKSSSSRDGVKEKES